MSKFIIADSAQIEARVLAWLSGQDDLLQGFADGEDVYSQFATTLFKCTVRKPDEEDPEPVQKYLTIKRGFGKDAILGAGYGMGAAKFYERCLQNPDLRPLFDSGAYDFKFVQALIKTYRTTYSKIPQFWTKIEKCFKWVVKYPNATAQYGPLNLWNNSGTVCIELPSTRVLYYRHAKINSRRELSYQHGSLWGGSICENLVQAIARDLLGYWILEFEDRGFPVVLHSHDEIVTTIDGAEKKLNKALAIMKSAPEWAKEIPLDAEGCVSEVYTK